jgi:hypothetical protein
LAVIAGALIFFLVRGCTSGPQTIPTISCWSCDGTGQTTCRNCSGSGKVAIFFSCSQCAGKGKVTCTHCNGSGQNPPELRAPPANGLCAARADGVWWTHRADSCSMDKRTTGCRPAPIRPAPDSDAHNRKPFADSPACARPRPTPCNAR